MRKQVLTARQRILARLSPCLLLIQRQLDALIMNLIFPYLVRHLHAPGSAYTPYHPPRSMHTLILHKLAELTQTLEEGDHSRVEFTMQEAKVDGEISGRVEFQALAVDGG